MTHAEPPAASEISYLFLTVSDVATALSFYRDTLGFELVFDGAPEFAFVRLPTAPRPQLALYRASPDDPPSSTGRLLAFGVLSVDEWRRHLEREGREPSDIEEVPGGLVVRFRDPDGNQLEVHQPT